MGLTQTCAWCCRRSSSCANPVSAPMCEPGPCPCPCPCCVLLPAPPHVLQAPDASLCHTWSRWRCPRPRHLRPRCRPELGDGDGDDGPADGRFQGQRALRQDAAGCRGGGAGCGSARCCHSLSMPQHGGASYCSPVSCCCFWMLGRSCEAQQRRLVLPQRVGVPQQPKTC